MSETFEIAAVSDYLERAGISPSGSIVLNPTDKSRVLIFIHIHRDSDNRQFPSNTSLAKAQRELATLGVNVDFILTDSAREELEAGSRANLLHAFGSLVRNSFLSIDKNKATLWIDAKKDLTSDQLVAIKDRANLYLSLFGIETDNVYVTKDENLPTKSAFLRSLRTLSPASEETITAHLNSLGFSIPSADWISRRLDALRKGGFVIRQKNELYALTQRAISALGTVRNYSSPDIVRLLDLARRGG